MIKLQVKEVGDLPYLKVDNNSRLSINYRHINKMKIITIQTVDGFCEWVTYAFNSIIIRKHEVLTMEELLNKIKILKECEEISSDNPKVEYEIIE